MKCLKWCIAMLCLVMLTACAEQQPIHGPVRKQTSEPAQEQEQRTPAQEQETSEVWEQQPQIEEEFAVFLDGKRADLAGVYFGGEPTVDLEKAEALFDVALDRSMLIRIQGREYGHLTDVCRQAGVELVQDRERDRMYLRVPTGPWQIPEGYRVPTLMYHGVSNDMWGMTELFVMPERMEEQFRYLVENGYTPIFFEELRHVDEIEKPVLLTYDDGYVDNYVDLFPLVKKYGVKINIFLVTGTVDNNPNSLTSAQIEEMHESGLVSFQSHTVTHPYLRGMSRQAQEYELAQSKLDIARLTGAFPTVICYPSGSFDETTMELARQYYNMGINMNGNEYITGEDPYCVDRYYIRRQDTLGTFIQYIQ